MATQKTVSFRMDEDKVEALDGIAASVDRDRSYLLNEAVRNYLELQEYHRKLIEAGLEAAKTGKYLSVADMRKRVAKLARARRSK